MWCKADHQYLRPVVAHKKELYKPPSGIKVLRRQTKDWIYIQNKFLQEIKIKVCELFISFMHQTLNYTLKKLGSKVNENKLKNFVECFLAHCYLKIPKVINIKYKILKALIILNIKIKYKIFNSIFIFISHKF